MTNEEHPPISGADEAPQSVDVTVKFRAELDARWPKPAQPYQGDFLKFVQKVVYDIFDSCLSTHVWEGDTKWTLYGKVVDVEADAGEWGYDAVDEDSDNRLFIRFALVPR